MSAENAVAPPRAASPAVHRCCVRIRGVSCDSPGMYEADPTRLDRAAAFPRSNRNGAFTWDESVSLVSQRKRWVCGEHVFDVCQPCLVEPYGLASSEQQVKRRDFVKVVECVAAAATPVAPSPPRRRHTIAGGPLPQPLGQAAPEKDLLTKLFEEARPLISQFSFFYSFLVTALRHVLYLNGKAIEGQGGHIWHGDKHGTDVLGWSGAVLSISSKSTLNAISGGAIPEDTVTMVDGRFDLRLLALPGIPSVRQLQRYMNNQWPLEKVIAPSQELVDVALNYLGLGNPQNRMLALTIDAVYGESHAEILRKLDGEYVVVGAATKEDLRAAAWRASDLGDLLKLDENNVATELFSVVLQDFHSQRKCLISLIPINKETGALVAKIFLKVRDFVFFRGSWLVFAGGDGARSNIEAWRRVALVSKGDATTDLRRVERVEDLPFAWSGDDNQHNTKGLKRDADGDVIFIGGELVRVDRAVALLRGFVPDPGSADVVLATPGDTSYSTVRGRSLVEVLPDGAASTFHQEYSKVCTKIVVDSKDSMASRPAELQGRLGSFLRRVGLDAEATYCDLIWSSHCCARAIDVDDGRALSPTENLAQMRAFTGKLTGIRAECVDKLEQGSRGAARLRGFISEDLYRLFLQSEKALDFIIKVAEASGMSEGLRSTLPYSEANETYHGVLRRIDKQLRISSVARATSKILTVMMLIVQQARSWPWRVGAGADGCYESRSVSWKELMEN